MSERTAKVGTAGARTGVGPGGAAGIDRAYIAVVQSRTVWALVAGQVLGGLGIGATVSFGALLAAHVSGDEALSGTAATLSTLGAAAASIPLARLASKLGRRIALTMGTATSTLGSVVIVAAAGIGSFPLLLAGFALLGVGAAVNLQSRFAATDLAAPQTRGRQLSLVVWSTTIGAVVGPNLSGAGEDMAGMLNMPHLTGSFAFAIAAQLTAIVVYLVALRPDPYLLSRRVAEGAAATSAATAATAAPTAHAAPGTQGSAPASAGSQPANTASAGDVAGSPTLSARRARTMTVVAIAVIGAAHAVMVGVMAMTPLHLTHHGSSIAAVGFTISLHVAGMFALSPVFGWMSDRFGRVFTILVGQGLLGGRLVAVALGEHSATAVTVGLTLIGLGWSATTVSGSALVTDLATDAGRTRIQGRTDLVMNASGAVGGSLSGPILAAIGYAGLATVSGIFVVAVVVAISVVGRAAR
jgi:MFS family permease